MHARRLATADSFLEAAGPFLLAHEAEHNPPLGLLGRLRAEPRLYGFDPIYVVVENEEYVAGCLLRTPPYGAILSRFEALAGVDVLVRELRGESLPGVLGPSGAVGRFAAGWAGEARVSTRVTLRQRVHAAGHVLPLTRAPGRMRVATPEDAELVVEWIAAFAAEVLPDSMHVEDARASYERRARDRDGAWLLWDDGEPVSLAAYGNPTPSGQRVGPVYTPPEFRGRGYATSLVADLTAERLAAGARFCFLFTDLANPTSNAIYARIGYEPVADWDQWLFEGIEG